MILPLLLLISAIDTGESIIKVISIDTQPQRASLDNINLNTTIFINNEKSDLAKNVSLTAKILDENGILQGNLSEIQFGSLEKYETRHVSIPFYLERKKYKMVVDTYENKDLQEQCHTEKDIGPFPYLYIDMPSFNFTNWIDKNLVVSGTVYIKNADKNDTPPLLLKIRGKVKGTRQTLDETEVKLGSIKPGRSAIAEFSLTIPETYRVIDIDLEFWSDAQFIGFAKYTVEFKESNNSWLPDHGNISLIASPRGIIAGANWGYA